LKLKRQIPDFDNYSRFKSWSGLN